MHQICVLVVVCTSYILLCVYHLIMTSYSFSLICVNLPSQHFQASVAGETCGTITGDPITPAVVEPYLWWPSGVGKATPNLLEATTEVDILDSVSGSVGVHV